MHYDAVMALHGSDVLSIVHGLPPEAQKKLRAMHPRAALALIAQAHTETERKFVNRIVTLVTLAIVIAVVAIITVGVVFP